jgi:hypothetical protein
LLEQTYGPFGPSGAGVVKRRKTIAKHFNPQRSPLRTTSMPSSRFLRFTQHSAFWASLGLHRRAARQTLPDPAEITDDHLWKRIAAAIENESKPCRAKQLCCEHRLVAAP